MSDGTLYVSNLPWSTDDAALLEAFSKYGSVKEARVVMRGARSRGFGFVTFETEAEASAAIALSGSSFGEGENVRQIGVAKARGNAKEDGQGDSQKA